MYVCNREACIILNANKNGKNFKLERGNAQGDTISPFLFNFCYQVLILKNETSLQIKSIFSDIPDPDPVAEGAVAAVGAGQEPAAGQDQQEEPVRLLPRKVFAFADDCNILTTQDLACINEIKNILNNFKTLSGLECNLSKTNILQISNDDTKIENTGFNDCSVITILGMEF
jgi:hypothetical protein